MFYINPVYFFLILYAYKGHVDIVKQANRMPPIIIKTSKNEKPKDRPTARPTTLEAAWNIKHTKDWGTLKEYYCTYNELCTRKYFLTREDHR